MDARTLLKTEIYGGTLSDWAVALGIAAVVVLAVMLAKPVLVRRVTALAQRTHTSIDDAVVRAISATKLLLVAVIAFYIGTQSLELEPKTAKAIRTLATIAFFLQAGLWANALLKFWLNRSEARAKATDIGAATSLAAVGFIGSIVLWALVTLLALDNLGINITALIAGLGIGGIAVALAVQNILGDLFASLSIVIDKPFVNGDFIIVDSYMGTVEHVGLKTTRIRSLDGEQIVFSNSDLLNTRIRNYKRMYERRIVFRFGVTYDTPPDRIEMIPALIKRLIQAHDTLRFDRAHFWRLGESSLDFESVFWVTNPDYNLYMDIQQALNLAVMRELTKIGVELAFPTRTIQVEGPVRVEDARAGDGDGRPPREPVGASRPPAGPS